MKINLILPFLIFFVSCINGNQEQVSQTDPLPSWNESSTKAAIIRFVDEVTDASGPGFIPVADRIAVFDNDGNLWSEKPVYFQLVFAMDRVKAMADQHPEWANEQPFKAVLENDMDALLSFGEHGLLQIVMATHAGIDTDEFEAIVKDWLSTARHPRFDRPYTDLVYQPMIELIRFLQDNQFKTFIVSGGGIEFMRPWVETAYGIPRDQVVGSSIKTEVVYQNEIPVIKRLPEIDFIDDKDGKIIGIHKFIGRKPIFCSGNSDGDLPMMKWTSSGDGKRFNLYLHHTDSAREWAYDRNSPVGRLNKGLDEAEAKGWTLIDMKKDWKIVYPYQVSDE